MFKLPIYIPLFLSILLMLNSCGEENSPNSLSSDITSKNSKRGLKLISPKEINLYENQSNAITLFAVSKYDVTYSISKGDSKEFDLNTKSGVITFKVAPDYENKKLYTFTAKVRDNKGNEHIENIIINILDINENEKTSSNVNRVLYVSQIRYPGDPLKPAPPRQTGGVPTPNNPNSPANVVQPTQPNPQPTQPTQPNPQPTPQPNPDVNEAIRIEIDKVYTRDNYKNVVTDDTTNLMWQDNNDVRTVRMTWNEAKIYCDHISLAGYSDWRLPSLLELNGIMDNKRSDTAISGVFHNVISRNYWSSTRYAPNFENAWTINLYHGNTYGSYQSSLYYVTCVRNIY